MASCAPAAAFESWCRCAMNETCASSFSKSAAQEGSKANIEAHIATKGRRRSSAGDCSSFRTYGNIPTQSARFTARAPSSMNRRSSTNARTRCACDSKTCSTTGSCSGGRARADKASRWSPKRSQTSNAVSCSSKNGDGSSGRAVAGGSAARPRRPRNNSQCGRFENCEEGNSCSPPNAKRARHPSAARSHAAQSGWSLVGGSFGSVAGVHRCALRTLSARR
mmetsp:Transcript_9180/g.30355  ORF Transcript_9180/g.30355 Transcript_9180/m.30355 type:complete len:222 (+) Transcript_9180:487-1152(+)